jgi:two-component system sensor histidine kinase BaeS
VFISFVGLSVFYSLRTKLFLSILLVNTLLILAVLWLNGASFNQNFADYVNRQEARRLQPILTSLAQYHQEVGHWNDLKAEPQRWRELLSDSYIGIATDRRRSAMRPPYADKLIFKSEQGNMIIGREGTKSRWVWLPVISKQNEAVGYIGYQPNDRIDAQVDNLFRDQFKTQIRWIGFVVLVTSGLFAILLSGAIARPLRKISSALRLMAAGNYQSQAQHSSKDELGQLAKDVNHLAITLSENQKSRSQWVTDIAHELRTPIAVLLADIESIQDGVRKVNEEWLKSMHWQASRIGRLVNDLNELSVSEAGALQYRFDTIDVTSFIKSSVEQYQHQLAQASITLKLELPSTPIVCLADEQRCEQLISNLLQNTLRYTDAPGRLHIKLSIKEDQIVLQWSDSGPGVNDNELGKLFDRLYRVDGSRNRETGGSGLGLAIVKNIVIAHKGSVQAKHSHLGGVSIEIILPMQKLEK